ncbi:MAG: L,D-transpeptidase family protein [Armatimonadota bacterium]|nr:L,D-transpeptidase family protein [bacterium]
MKWFGAVLVLFLCTVGGAEAQSVSITKPNRAALLEGQNYTITWNADDVKSASVVAYGPRTPLGGKSRGNFSIVIANRAPAGSRAVNWRVPWIDAIRLSVKIKGYDSQGRLTATSQRNYGFRPKVLANRTQDGIYLDLHKRTDQRLYVQQHGKLTRAYLSSSSSGYDWLPPKTHIPKPHDHAGVFSVLEKTPNHHSQLFDVDMPWAMRYHGGHFIHATTSAYYKYLGTSASHGCNRLTISDARQLYKATPVGTRVEVIGPKG